MFVHRPLSIYPTDKKRFHVASWRTIHFFHDRHNISQEFNAALSSEALNSLHLAAWQQPIEQGSLSLDPPSINKRALQYSTRQLSPIFE